jgi:hypothetical protein
MAERHDEATIERVLDLRRRGASASAIAGVLRLTRNMVIGLIDRARRRGDPRAALQREPRRGARAGAPRAPRPLQPRKPARPKPAKAVKPAAPAKAARPVLPVLPAGPFVEPTGVSLLEASAAGCRWVVGHDNKGALFCDAPRLAGARYAWCPGHYKRGVARAEPGA